MNDPAGSDRSRRRAAVVFGAVSVVEAVWLVMLVWLAWRS